MLRQGGFTLVEMMVAFFITAFLVAGILSSYTFIGHTLVRGSFQQMMEIQTRRALQMFAQDVHAATNVSSFSSSAVALTMPYVHTDYSVTTYTVTYTYSASAGTLVRSVTGTPPPGATTNSITLLTGVSNLTFNYLDMQGQSVTGTSYPLRVKQIELSNITLVGGTAAAGTQSTYSFASARFILRSKHLVLTQNGTSY